jgi:hypothetical protein
VFYAWYGDKAKEINQPFFMKISLEKRKGRGKEFPDLKAALSRNQAQTKPLYSL